MEIADTVEQQELWETLDHQEDPDGRMVVARENQETTVAMEQMEPKEQWALGQLEEMAAQVPQESEELLDTQAVFLAHWLAQ